MELKVGSNNFVPSTFISRNSSSIHHELVLKNSSLLNDVGKTIARANQNAKDYYKISFVEYEEEDTIDVTFQGDKLAEHDSGEVHWDNLLEEGETNVVGAEECSLDFEDAIVLDTTTEYLHCESKFKNDDEKNLYRRIENLLESNKVDNSTDEKVLYIETKGRDIDDEHDSEYLVVDSNVDESNRITNQSGGVETCVSSTLIKDPNICDNTEKTKNQSRKLLKGPTKVSSSELLKKFDEISAFKSVSSKLPDSDGKHIIESNGHELSFGKKLKLFQESSDDANKKVVTVKVSPNLSGKLNENGSNGKSSIVAVLNRQSKAMNN